MRLFSKKKKTGAPTVQMRGGSAHPFGTLAGYVPMRRCETELYRSIREAVPVVDAAVIKIIRLTGGVYAECGDKRAERQLNKFLRTVPTGRGQRGINSFISSYLDSMITCGMAVGEIALRGDREIGAVICGDTADIEIRDGGDPLSFEICMCENGEIKPLPYQELLLFTPFNPEAGSPYGVSLMRSMPFLTDILLKIYSAIGTNWERVGNVRFAVTYRPHGDIIDKYSAAERTSEIADQWGRAMRETRSGHVRDFVAAGDVDIKVIGAENQIPDSEIPVRQITEQLVARTGIPPFMLGLTWSSTERMSAQQADIMTSEITAIRRSLEPTLEKIFSIWLHLNGYDTDFRVRWDEINLQDEVEVAQADLYRAQAEKIRCEMGMEAGEENW